MNNKNKLVVYVGGCLPDYIGDCPNPGDTEKVSENAKVVFELQEKYWKGHGPLDNIYTKYKGGFN